MSASKRIFSPSSGRSCWTTAMATSGETRSHAPSTATSATRSTSVHSAPASSPGLSHRPVRVVPPTSSATATTRVAPVIGPQTCDGLVTAVLAPTSAHWNPTPMDSGNGVGSLSRWRLNGSFSSSPVPKNARGAIVCVVKRPGPRRVAPPGPRAAARASRGRPRRRATPARRDPRTAASATDGARSAIRRRELC